MNSTKNHPFLSLLRASYCLVLLPLFLAGCATTPASQKASGSWLAESKPVYVTYEILKPVIRVGFTQAMTERNYGAMSSQNGAAGMLVFPIAEALVEKVNESENKDAYFLAQNLNAATGFHAKFSGTITSAIRSQLAANGATLLEQRDATRALLVNIKIEYGVYRNTGLFLNKSYRPVIAITCNLPPQQNTPEPLTFVVYADGSNIPSLNSLGNLPDIGAVEQAWPQLMETSLEMARQISATVAKAIANKMQLPPNRWIELHG